MQKLAFFRDAPAPWQGTPQGGPAITMEAMTMTMTETEALGIIRSITGISQQAGEQVRQDGEARVGRHGRCRSGHEGAHLSGFNVPVGDC